MGRLICFEDDIDIVLTIIDQDIDFFFKVKDLTY